VAGCTDVVPMVVFRVQLGNLGFFGICNLQNPHCLGLSWFESMPGSHSAEHLFVPRSVMSNPLCQAAESCFRLRQLAPMRYGGLLTRVSNLKARNGVRLNSVDSSDEIDCRSPQDHRSDRRNLGPESYAATLWNACVKDALEDRLRELVCDGTIRRLRPLSLIFHGISRVSWTSPAGMSEPGQKRVVGSWASLGRITQINRPNLLARKTERKRLRVTQFGRFIRVYRVQSVHAPLIRRFDFG
jgi:hypothetical protein